MPTLFAQPVSSRLSVTRSRFAHSASLAALLWCCASAVFGFFRSLNASNWCCVSAKLATITAIMMMSVAAAQTSAYVKVSNSGAYLAATAQIGDGPNDWGCTLIPTSGAMWEVQRPTGSRAKTRLFTYYTSTTEAQKYDGTTYSAPTAQELASADNAPVFIAEANTRSMCGRTNWSFGDPITCTASSCGVNFPAEWFGEAAAPITWWTGGIGYGCPFGGCSAPQSAYGTYISNPFYPCYYGCSAPRSSLFGVWLTSSAPATSALELAAPWIEPGETTTLLTDPPNATLGTCSSASTAIATVSGNQVTGVARGDTTITCGALTVPVKVRLPWVTSIEPKQYASGVTTKAILGEHTVFTVTGQDLHIGNLNFSLSNCVGGTTPIDYIFNVGLPAPTTWPAPLETVEFTCFPAALEYQSLTLNRLYNVPQHNYADRRLHPDSPAHGGPDCAESYSCSVRVYPGGTITDPAVIAGLVDNAVAPYVNASGKVPWWSLTEDQLTDIGKRMTAANISHAMPPLWLSANATERAYLSDQRDVAIRDVAGLAAVKGYTWKDKWSASLYTGWISTSFGYMTGEEWLKLAGGVAINGSIAIMDAVTLGGASKAKAVGSAFSRKLARFGELSLFTPTGKLGSGAMGRLLRSMTQVSSLMEMGATGWNTWAAEDKIAVAIALDASSIAGASELKAFILAGEGALDEHLAGIAAKFVTNSLLNLVTGSVKLGLAPSETVSIANVLSTYKDGVEEAFWSALPIAGAVKDLGELTYKISDRAYTRFFEDTDRLSSEFRDAQAKVNRRYRIGNFIRVYEQAHGVAGSENLNIKPPVLANGLPLAWGAPNFAASVKKLVVATHGWNSEAGTWSSDLLAQLCAKVGATVHTEAPGNNPLLTGVAQWCNVNDFLIVTFNWKDKAELLDLYDSNGAVLRSPTPALRNAQVLGLDFGEYLDASGIRPDFAHLIGHSAGSGFIEELAGALKSKNIAGVRHLTFLDAYCPDQNNCEYGANATWAEQYVYQSKGRQWLPSTDVTLPAAYNFDVSELYDDASDLLPTAGHAYPYWVYVKSTELAGSATANALHLSELGVHLAGEFWYPWSPLTTAQLGSSVAQLASTYPVGRRCAISSHNLATKARAGAPGECNWVEYAGVATRTNTTTTNQGIYSSCSSPPVLPPGSFVTTSCLTSAAYARAAGTAAASTVAMGNARQAMQFASASNTVSFNYQFMQAPAGTVAQVFLDDQLLMVIRGDAADTQLKHAANIGFERIEPGLHYLQVVLTGGSSATTRLDLTNIVFELVKKPVLPGISQNVSATPGYGQASITFSAPTSNGGSPITGYTATCSSASGDSVVQTGAASPLVVTGLIKGRTYSCTVSATNFVGIGPASIAVSVSITTGPTVLFSEDFNGPTSLDTAKWTVVTLLGDPASQYYGTSHPAALSFADGKMIADVPGGARGFNGQPDGSSFTPKGVSISGDYSVTMEVTELLRQQSGTYKDSSGVVLVAGDRSLQIFGNYAATHAGYAYGQYNKHRIEGFGPTGSCLLNEGLDLASLYTVELRIVRTSGSISMSYRLNGQPWASASCGNQAGTVTPYFSVVSGDGGGTLSNGRIKVAANYFTITVPELTSQTVQFGATPSLVVGGSATVSATASSGLPVSFSAATSSAGICALSNSTVTGLGVGLCTIYGDQAGNSTYSAAPQRVMSFTVQAAVVSAPSAPTNVAAVAGPGRTTLTFSPPASTGGAAIVSYTATCTASGQTTRTATGTSSPLVVSGLTPGIAYSCSVTANNGTYSSPASTTVMTTVNKAVDLTPILMLLD